jgi:hypothetical protein
LKQPTIPRIALPKDKLCALNELQLNAKNPTEDSIDKREMYAKMALLMFYPFHQLTDLTCKKSYWKSFIWNSQNITRKKTHYSGRKGLKYFRIDKTGTHFKNM